MDVGVLRDGWVRLGDGVAGHCVGGGGVVYVVCVCVVVVLICRGLLSEYCGWWCVGVWCEGSGFL